MSWLKGKIFGQHRTREEEMVGNLYQALVLGGGPSSEAESHIDADILEVPLDKLDRFSAKRLITLEAFLFVATNAATMPVGQADGPPLSFHPLVEQMGLLLREKWAQRGIQMSNSFAVGNRCFAEVELALEKPFKWGRAWLDEFYSDPSKSGEHYITWTEQCLNEYQAMIVVIKKFA